MVVVVLVFENNYDQIVGTKNVGTKIVFSVFFFFWVQHIHDKWVQLTPRVTFSKVILSNDFLLYLDFENLIIRLHCLLIYSISTKFQNDQR